MSDPHPWHRQETYKGLINLSQTALKGALLVNGGACVAFLAFMGRFFDGEIGQAINPTLALYYPMLCFIGGLFIAGLASGIAYIAQLNLFNEEMRPKEPRRWHQKSNPWLWTGVASFVLSYLAFAVGAVMAAYQLT